MSKIRDSEILLGSLSYLGVFVTGFLIILLEHENKFVRFHALQSVLFFGGSFVLVLAMQFYPWGWIPGLLVTCTAMVFWVVLLWKSFQGEMYKLPFVGELAVKQLAKMDA